jgi:hypothetical protein
VGIKVGDDLKETRPIHRGGISGKSISSGEIEVYRF